MKRTSKKRFSFCTFCSLLPLNCPLSSQNSLFSFSLLAEIPVVTFKVYISLEVFQITSAWLSVTLFAHLYSAHIWGPARCSHLCQGQGHYVTWAPQGAQRTQLWMQDRGMLWEHWQRMSQLHQWHQSPPYLSSFFLSCGIRLNCLSLHPLSYLGLYKAFTIWT